MARRSAIEIAAWLEIAARRGEASEPAVSQALQQVHDVVCMLVKLIRSCEPAYRQGARRVAFGR